MAQFDLAADPDGFSRAAADAVGVGSREAFGVRQLAAALFSCPNNVSGTISAWRPKQSACPHIGIAMVFHALPRMLLGVGSREAFGVRQLAAALFSCPNNVSGTISAWRPKQSACPHIGIPRKATCLALYWSQHPDNEPVTLFL